MATLLSGPALAQPPDWQREVAPIFERSCLQCHHEDEAKGGLNLATAAGLRAGSQTGPVIKTGSSDDSLLLQVVSGDKPRMPKKGAPLSAREQEILAAWIKGGATWPDNVKLEDRS